MEDEPIDFTTTPTIHRGDINERAIGITFETARAILSNRDGVSGDALALYCFYCFTARWQKHGQLIRATTGYSASGLGWSSHRTRQARRRLEELALIKDIVKRSDDGSRIAEHRIEVRFLLSSTLAVFNPQEIQQGRNSPAIADKERELKNSKAKRREWEASVDFVDDDIQSEWTAYQMMYRQKFGNMTIIARGRKVNKLSKWPKEKALQALRDATDKEWRDVYEPREQRKPQLPYKKREAIHQKLNERLAELHRLKQTPEVQREIARLQAERYKL